MPIVYRREPAKSGSELRAACDRLLRDIDGWRPAPAGFRLKEVQMASGLWLRMEHPGGEIRIQIIPKGPDIPHLCEAGDVLLRVAGEEPKISPALSGIAWLAAGLRSLASRGQAGYIPELVLAATAYHDWIGKASPLRIHGPQAELRLLLSCNQKCFFCNCDENAPNLVGSAREAEQALLRFYEAGARRLVLTGGEPTLHAGLKGIVAFARRIGFSFISLQTNAMLLGEGSLAGDLHAAGLDSIFASLHGTHAKVVDILTGVHGGFERTLRGIEECINQEIAVTINFVASKLNLRELPKFISWVKIRFPQGIHGVVLSFMAPVAAGKANLKQVPRLSEARTVFLMALEEGRRCGIPVRVAGICGVPLCQAKGYEAQCDEVNNPVGVEIPSDRRLGHRCLSCAYGNRCTGFWRIYLDAFGEDELLPFSEEDLSSAGISS